MVYFISAVSETMLGSLRQGSGHRTAKPGICFVSSINNMSKCRVIKSRPRFLFEIHTYHYPLRGSLGIRVST